MALFLVVPVGLKFVHLVHAEALAVMVAVTADLVFNHWDLEILPYYRIRHIPMVNMSVGRFLKGSDLGVQHSELQWVWITSIIWYSKKLLPA
jgi:hypothetical protein